ncbi:MAG: Zn-ribbon domain-containing OB-fold protein [Bryobacteraceae bacterium]
MTSGTVYTETVIYSAPEAFTKDVPYQTAIVSLDGGTGRVTGRVIGERVAIGDRVIEVEERSGVPYFRKVVS